MPKKITPVWMALGAAGAAAAGAYAVKGAHYRHEAGLSFRLDDPPPPGTSAFARLVESWCGAPARDGNRVEVLRNGEEIFPSMLEAIASATRTVDFSTYIMWAGDTATTFAEALMDRARAGVNVNVMLDAWGSAQMDRTLVTRMEEAGARFVWFRTPRWYTLDKLNNRSHRRILVIDGRVGFTGGMGVAEEWAGDAAEPGSWRETHLRVEGPAVRDLVGAFADHWVEETGEVLGGDHLPELTAFDDGVAVQVSKSSASGGRAAAEALIFAAIVGARDRLWLTTAYFAPRRALVDALVEAAERGVDVRILVNGPNIDKEVVRRVGQRSYAGLLEGGVRVFEYQRTMMHAKVVLADDCWANVGTANFDNRSLSLQDEMNCSVVDAGLVAELEKHFLHDFDGSEEILLERWRERPLRARAFEAAAESVRHSL